MKYTSDQAVSEIMKRSGKILKKRRQAMRAALSGVSVLLFALLVTTIAGFSGFSASGVTESVYGSLMLPQQAGGYVLVAVLAFAFGMILAVLLMYYRNHQNNGKENGGKEDE